VSTIEPSQAAPSIGAQGSEVRAEAASRGLFVRKSSGLVRDLGIGGAFGLNIGWLSVGGALGYMGVAGALFPGVNIFWALLVGGLLTGTLGFVYSQLGAAIPRSGGDYVYQSRIFHPAVGTWIGVTFIIYMVYTMASSGSYYASTFLPYIFATLGSALHVGFLNTLATDVTTQTGTLIAGFAVLLIACFAVARGVGVAGRTAYWLVVAGLVSVALIILELFIHTGTGFVSAFDHASGSKTAYAAIVSSARAHGWTPGTTVSQTINAIPYGFLIFGGFWFTVYAGGEVKQPARTQKLAMFLAFGFGLVFIVMSWVAMRSAASQSFVQASTYLQTNDPTLYAKLTSVASISPQQYAVVVAGDPVTKCIMALGYLGWIFSGVTLALVALSRMLFALSFDRVLPGALAKVSGRRHSPFVALGVALVVVLGLMTLIIYDTGIVNSFRNVIIIGVLIALMACLAAIALPYRRKDLYDASPKVLAGRLLGVERIVWVSGIALAFCIVLMYLTLTKGQYNGGFNTTSVISIVLYAFIGLPVYFIVRAVRRRQGMDIALAMHELPPE
jgi:amino acid transporter